MTKLPDSELEVMLAIWNGVYPVHTGEILQRLTQKRSHKLQSVQILLGRLVDKGFLRCEKIGRLNYYTPLVEMEVYRNNETNSFMDKLYGNSPVGLIAALVQQNQLSKKELEEIKMLLEQGGGEQK